MWRFKTMRVAQNQRVAWFRDGNFQGLLEPGKYRFWRRLRQTTFHSYDVMDAECELPQLRFLAENQPAALEAHLQVFSMGEREVGLVLVDKMARKLLLPGEWAAYWREFHSVEIRTLDVSVDTEVPVEWIRAINRSGRLMHKSSLAAAIQPVGVEEGFETIVLLDGEIARALQPGRYAFWKIGREIKALAVDMRVQEVEINGQEILTKDRVSLRTNASLQYRIQRSRQAAIDTPDVAALAYRTVQFALRRAIGALTLDELLADKTRLSDSVHSEVAVELEKAGVAVVAVGIKDIILPGEMKTILNQVVEAEKVAEANAIRRRDDTQSVRALANTARQLESNPMMARLKELETLEQVTAGIDSLNVFNGLDGVLNQLVNLHGTSAPEAAEKGGS